MTSDSPIAEVALHPVRLRIVRQLVDRRLTTGQLRDALPDVSQATLYRHVAALVAADIVEVVEERRVRGTVERTLALGARTPAVGHEEMRAMTDAELRAAFLTFLSTVAEDFDRMIDDASPDARGFVGFNQTVLHLCADDLPDLQAGLIELLKPYRTPRDGQTRRISLSTVLLPES